MPDPVDSYERGFREHAARFESVAFEDVHRRILPFLPARMQLVLDVGAGSGRDAAWFAAHGAEVVAVEPARALRDLAQRLHPSPRIRWLDDRLPALAQVNRLGLTYDVIWLSAVWMHVAPPERARAFRKLAALLRPGGRMVLSLRQGACDPERVMHPVAASEVEALALQHGLTIRATLEDQDALARADVFWQLLVLELPDDATGALSTLRGIILRDAKSATYKLALLRALTVCADRAASLARAQDDAVAVPLGLVALYWVRMFRPLLAASLPQGPVGRGLGFVKQGFQELDVASVELRPGAAFGEPQARLVHQAIRDAAATIARNPAHYTTWADGRPVFPTRTRTPAGTGQRLLLDEPYLWSFGEVQVPMHLWAALRRLAIWIEPVLLHEWVEQMRRFARAAGNDLPTDLAFRQLRWIDPARDTQTLRRTCGELIERGKPVHCIWTDRRLSMDRLEVDHAFPWSAWPCDDLWNLVPASRDANQAKRHRLITAELLERKRDRLAEWWHMAFLDRGEPLRQRFLMEARTSLPLAHDRPDPASLVEGMRLLRLRLHQDQNLPAWNG